MCETEYRRFPVVDNNGNSPGYLQVCFLKKKKSVAKFFTGILVFHTVFEKHQHRREGVDWLPRRESRTYDA